MPTGIATTITNTDHTMEEINEIARKCKVRKLSKRLRAIALVMEGELSRSEIAKRSKVDVQTIRDWVIRYNSGGVGALKDQPRSGRPTLLDAASHEQVRHWLEDGPAEGISAWTIGLLRCKIKDVFGIELCIESVRRVMRRLGFRRLSPRPEHPKGDPEARRYFRHNFRKIAMSFLPPGTDPASVDIWFQDEARIGQKGMLTRVWALRGTRPRVPRDHRFGYCYLFSVICPATGAAVGHICDRANTGEMNHHLRDISDAVPAGRHALVVLDNAGWHRAKDLEVPKNVTLMFLPPYSPELNPVENVFQFLKARHFSNRVFATAEVVKNTVAEVWENFVASPKRITSIGTREWARLTVEVT